MPRIRAQSLPNMNNSNLECSPAEKRSQSENNLPSKKYLIEKENEDLPFSQSIRSAALFRKYKGSKEDINPDTIPQETTIELTHQEGRTELNDTQPMIPFDDNLKQQIGEDKYNEVNQKLTEYINNNDELKSSIEALEMDFEALNVEFKASYIASQMIKKDSSLDNLDIKYPLTIALFGLLTPASAGVNQFVLADPNASITAKEIFASQYVVPMCLLSAIEVTNSIHGHYSTYLNTHNQQEKLEPSDETLNNCVRVTKQIMKDFYTAPLLGKGQQLFNATLIVSSVVLAYYSAETDYKNAIEGIKSFCKQLGADDPATIDHIAGIGYFNLISAIVLGTQVCYEVQKTSINAFGDVVKYIVNRFKSEKYLTSEELKLKKNQQLISNSILETITNCSNENKLDDMLPDLKDNLIKTLKSNNITNVNQSIEEVQKMSLQKSRPFRDCVFSTALLGATAGFAYLSIFTFSGAFGSSAVTSKALEFAKENAVFPNNGTQVFDNNESFPIALQNNVTGFCLEFIDCLRKYNFGELYLTDDQTIQVFNADSANKRANAIQGFMFGIFFLYMLCKGIKVLMQLAKECRSPAQLAKKVANLVKSTITESSKKELAKSLLKFTVIATSITSFLFYANNLLATEESAKGYYQLQGEDWVADNSYLVSWATVAVLSVFLYDSIKSGPEMIMKVPELVMGSIKSIKKAVCYLPKLAYKFIVKEQPVQSRNVQTIELV